MVRHFARRSLSADRRPRNIVRGLIGLAGLLSAALALAQPASQPAASAPAASLPAPRDCRFDPPPTRAAIITVDGMIDDVLRRSIQRRVDEARKDGVDLIVFEMNTKGGLVTSALDIAKIIKKLPDEGIRTVAWVNDQAYSAGALISVAAQHIVVAPGSSIGDCAPIMVSPAGGMEELGEAERAKAESPILQSFRDSALRNGYDRLLCRAMVAVGAEVWWVENTRTGERRFVDGAEKERLIDQADGQPLWQLVESYPDPYTGRDVPVRNPIDSGKELLTLSDREALAYGLACGDAASAAELAAVLELPGSPTRLESSGWEEFARWLNSPLVRGILFVIVLMGAYIEFHSPGLIVPGVTALVALAIFLGAPYAAGLASIWTIVLLVVGLVLLGFEIFVLPGFGIAGVLGVLLILIAFVASFVPAEPGAPPLSWPTLEATWAAIRTGIIVMASSIVIAVIGIGLLVRFLPGMAIGRGLVLENVGDPEELAVPDPAGDLVRVGDRGVVTGDLRPGGQARFGDYVIDVTTQGEYVEAGSTIEVLRREGTRIIVRPVSPEQSQA